MSATAAASGGYNSHTLTCNVFVSLLCTRVYTALVAKCGGIGIANCMQLPPSCSYGQHACYDTIGWIAVPVVFPLGICAQGEPHALPACCMKADKMRCSCWLMVYQSGSYFRVVIGANCSFCLLSLCRVDSAFASSTAMGVWPAFFSPRTATAPTSWARRMERELLSPSNPPLSPHQILYD